MVTENRITSGIDTNRDESVPNRIVVRGKSRANNHDNVIQIDDFGPQRNSVNEIPGGIHAPTAVTKASAKSIGQRMLKMAKNATGSKKMKDVMAATHIHPGDMVSYHSRTENERYKTIYNKDLYFKMLKALQEAQTRIETLETENTDIKARLTALENA